MRKTSIAFQIAVLLILVSVGATWVNFVQNMQTLEQALHASHKDKAERVAHTVSTLIRNNGESLRSVSRALRTHHDISLAMAEYARSGNAQPVRDVLQGLYPQLGLATLSVTDADGIALYHAHQPASVGDKVTRKGLSDALAGSEIMVFDRHGEPRGSFINVIAPVVLQGGKVAGALVVGALLDDAYARKLAQEAGSEISFATRDGLWSSSLPAGARHSLSATLENVARVLDDGKSRLVEDDADDTTRFFAPLRVVDETVALVVQMDTRAAMMSLQANRNDLMRMSVALVLISSALGMLFAHFLTRPLKRLQEDSLRLIRQFSSAESARPRGNEVTTAVHTLQVATQLLAQHADESQRARAKAEFAAQYDVLTHLPNRFLMQDRLGQALAGAERNHGRVGLLFIDLDNFKTINDSLGHHVGDQVLLEAASRLQNCVRDQDTVARLGGDEFVVILPTLKESEDAAVVARKIVKLLDSPSAFTGSHLLHVSASVGIGIYPGDARTAADLIKCADAAMYHAKEGGRNRYQFFAPEMNARANETLALESGLRLALERGEFEIYYQPQVALPEGNLIGMEALLRWRHPQRGLLTPETFIRVAEERGLILPIGEWVLHTACRQIRAWQDEGLAPIPVSVNVSPLQFRNKDLPDIIRAALRESGLDSRYLELEITEGALMHDSETTNNNINTLESMGLALSIDDFGTGYSSLSYLKRLPIAKVKVDRSFVGDIPGDEDDAAIVSAIIATAFSLKLDVIAEGVETAAQVAFLLAAGCDKAQGNYFSEPVPAAVFRNLMTAKRPVAPEVDLLGEPIRIASA